MPIYASAFFIPTSASIPYILEDVYLKGGYRSVATIAERDAIKTAARKQGALVYVREDNTIYWLPDAVIAGAAAWKPFDVTKYVNYIWKDPLKMEVGSDGKATVSIDEKRIVPLIIDEQNGNILLATAEGPKWQHFDPLPSRENAKKDWALVLDANKDMIWAPVSGLPPTDGVAVGSAVVLGADGPKWGDIATGTVERKNIAISFVSVAPDEVKKSSVDVPSGSLMILRLAVDQADVLVRIYSKSDYSDTNPYTFRSSATMLEDDGTSVAENGDVSRQRRYAFFAAVDATAPKMYIAVTNERPGATPIAVSLTVLPLE